MPGRRRACPRFISLALVSVWKIYWVVQDAFRGYDKLLRQAYWCESYMHSLFYRPDELR